MRNCHGLKPWQIIMVTAFVHDQFWHYKFFANGSKPWPIPRVVDIIVTSKWIYNWRVIDSSCDYFDYWAQLINFKLKSVWLEKNTDFGHKLWPTWSRCKIITPIANFLWQFYSFGVVILNLNFNELD